MNPNQINWLAVFAAALSTFVIGGLWYSPVLFGKVWMRVNGFSEEQVAGFNKARAFGGSFILALVCPQTWPCFWPTLKRQSYGE